MSEDQGALEEEWERLEKEIMTCRRCPLANTRTRPVPGEGDRRAEIMFIGEAPGATEDATGRPFVGAAGMLLRRILADLGIDERRVYITNVVKCRPPGNRRPSREEVEACSPYLRRQIQLLRPRVIVALGNVAGEWVFREAGREWESITRNRGRVYELELYGLRVSVVPTYHPSAAVRGSVDQETIRGDIGLAKSLLGRREEKRPVSLLDFMKRGS